MADKDLGVTADFNVDVSKSLGDIKNLDNLLGKLLGDLKHASTTISNSIQTNTADLQRAMKAASGDMDKLARIGRKLEQTRGAVLSNAAKGNDTTQLNTAATNKLINDELKGSVQALNAKVANAIVKAYGDSFKTTNEAIVARIKKELDNSQRMIKSSSDEIRRATMTRAAYSDQRLTSQYNDPEFLAAKKRIDDYNKQKMLERSQNIQQYNQPNQPQQQRGLFDSTNARFESNGGADIIAIQARLMLGYQALNMFFSAARNGAQFIVELDKELTQFQAITATSKTEMIGFKDTLIEVAQTSNFSAVELAKAATIMGQAGLSAREVGDTIKSVAMLATASGSDLASAVDVVTSALSIFNLQTSEAADIANTMTAALNESKLSIDKIALSLQYAGNIAAESGVGYKELLAVIGTLSNAGIKSGSTLGTGVRQLLVDIQNPTKKFKDALESVGLTEQDVSIRSKTLTGVLRTLHDAGFGTAQAFQAFEVRAAAAFAALDGNLDSITDMNQSFINSAAAVEANAIQMESLANKWARFSSNAGVLIDTLFRPLMGMLKSSVDGASELFAWLNKYPLILQTIGVLLTSILAMMTFNTAIASVKGLSIAMLGMVGVTRSAETAMWGLNFAMKANPWLILASVLIGGVVLLSNWGTAAETAAEKMDRLKGAVNDLKGDADATNQTIKGLTETSEQLLQQREALEADPILRKARISEIVDTFKELSTEINTSTSSVSDLIDAVNRLSQAQMKIRAGQLQLQYDAQKDIVDARKNDVNTAKNTGAQSLRSALTSDNAVEMMHNPNFRASVASGDSANYNRYISEAFQKQIPDQFDNLVSTATGQTPVKDINQLILSTGQLSKAIKELPAGSDEARTSMQALLEVLNKLIDAQKLLGGAEGDLNKTGKELGKAGVMTSSAYAQLQKDASRLTGNSESFQTRALGGNSPYATDRQMFEVNEYKVNLQKNIDDLTKQAEAAGGEVLATFKSDILPALSNQIALLDQIVSKRSEDYFKAKERELKKSDKLVSAKIASLVKRAGVADYTDEVQIYTDQIVREMNSRREALKTLFQERIGLTSGEDAEKLKDELDQALEQVSTEEDTLLTQMKARQDAIKEEFIKRQKDVVDDQISALNDKISENVEALKKLKPGPVFDKLKESILKMVDQLNGLMMQSNGLDMTLKNPNPRVGELGMAQVSGSQADRMAQAMNILMQTGNYSKAQASGLLGHLMQESGLDPNASGDGGLAKGIAQWHPDRQANMMDWFSKEGMQNTFENQVKWVDQELRTKYPEVFANLKTAQTPAEAVRKSAAYEGFKGYDTPTEAKAAENYAERTRFANTANTVSVADAEKIAQTRTDVNVTIPADAAKKALEASTDALVKSTTETLTTAISQAKISDDPEKIKAMIDGVDKSYEKIIKARTDEFKKTNPDAVAGDEATKTFDDSITSIQGDQQQKIAALMDTYWAAVTKKTEQPIKDAQAALDAAQKPENAGKYTSGEMAQLQGNVNMAQQAAQAQQLALATQMVAKAQTEAAAATATYGVNSQQVTFWTEQESQAKAKVVELTNQKNAADQATAKQGPSVAGAIQSANEQWAIQAGLMQRTASGAMQMVPLAQQVGNAWGGVLTGMTDNLSTLFTNLASGTMSAKDAMKQFALSTVQMFIQMIAKALAYQIILGTLGKVGTGGGFLSGLLGVPGAAQGEYIKGAAQGEMINTGLPTRDSTLRRVMKGEYILRRSAVKQIGRDNLDRVNSAGNRRMHKNGEALVPDQSMQGENIVNVWVISPDQQPQMGPNDVVAIVSDNIQRRGPLKHLIKSVQMGH